MGNKYDFFKFTVFILLFAAVFRGVFSYAEESGAQYHASRGVVGFLRLGRTRVYIPDAVFDYVRLYPRLLYLEKRGGK